MYFVEVKELAEDFRQGRVDERERFKYYFASTVTLAAFHLLVPYYGSPYDIRVVIFAAVCLTITIVGMLLCYRTNSNGDNRDFIARMICLTWPIGIVLIVRFLFAGFLVGFIYLVGFHIVYRAMGGDMSSVFAETATDRRLIGEVFSVFFEICWYWMMYKYLTLAAHGEPAERPH